MFGNGCWVQQCILSLEVPENTGAFFFAPDQVFKKAVYKL